MKVRINIGNIFKNKLKKGKDIKRRRVNKRKITKSDKENKLINNDLNSNNIRKRHLDKKIKDKEEFKVRKYSNVIKLEDIKKEDNISEYKSIEENRNYKRKGYIINFDNSVMINNVNEEDLDNKDGISKESEKVRNKKMSQKIKKSYYTLFFSMCLLGIFSVIFAIDSYDKYNLEDYVEYADINMSSVSSNSGNQDEASNNLDTNSLVEVASVNVNVDTVSSNLSNSTDSKNNTSTTNKVVPLSFSKAIEGQIQKIFSIDSVIYSKTLQMWKTHDGIDISASIGSVVKSIEKGVVEKVYNDSFYGMTVVIDHGQGYKSSYSNLDEEVFVKAKQVVKKGTKIGKVGSTAIGEIKDESHLHMSVIKNGEYIDPSSVIK